MTLFILTFLFGCSSVIWFANMPNLILLGLFALLSLFLFLKWKNKFFLMMIGFTFGLLWVMLFSSFHLHHLLEQSLEEKTVSIIGTISSIPSAIQNNVEFNFKTSEINQRKRHLNLQLTWYQTTTILHAGEKWHLFVRLKHPHGFMNPGGFDYEAWLFEKNISATGYVVNKQNNDLITSALSYPITHLREKLQEKVIQKFLDDPLAGFLPALLVGSRQYISQQQWQVLRATGTNHLIAIAGLHIGLVAAFIFFVANFLWCRSYRLLLILPAQQFAAMCSVFGAFCYSLLAGFPIQTQRAMIMLSLLLVVILMKRHILQWQTFFYALFLVLIINPLNVLTAGFWMSFVAVAFIIYAMQGRLLSHGFWWHWGRVQFAIMIGLLPLTMFIYHESSLVGFIANMIAVPWFAFVVMPLCVLSLFMMIFNQKFAFLCLWLVLKSLHLLWFLLTYLSQQSFSTFHPANISIITLAFSTIGALLLLSPKGFLGRKLCVIFFLPMLFSHQPTPNKDEIWLTLLDVGQGLSVFLQTKTHVMIYDTGPKFSENFNAGDAVILPYLFFNGIHHLNTLMISHGDNDHIGGSFAILNQIAVNTLLTIVPERFQRTANYCHAGEHWVWDDVTFQVLWPMQGKYSENNNSSCILKISNAQHSILLTGDIEKPVELELVKKYGNQLQSTILVVPHHGSKTSSSFPFINAVKPTFVLYGVGYRNRFHFPDAIIINRYRSVSAKQYETSKDGAITFKISNGEIKAPILYRVEHRHLWNEVKLS